MGVFDTRYKLGVHFVQILLVVTAIGLSVPRLFMTGRPRTRANTIALGMGAKSLIFIMYQILTENGRAFRRWASLKANLIINSLEIIFWAGVVFLVMQANLSRCVGIGCTVSWIVVGVGICLSILSSYAAMISYFEFREACTARSLPTVQADRYDKERGTISESSPDSHRSRGEGRH